MLYHGTDNGSIRQLRPLISEHGKPYIYFAENMVVAAFYTVHRVARPYNWFPYGFQNGIPVYYEYYPDALRDVYGGRTGYLYCCEESPDMKNPTSIHGAFVCEHPVEPKAVLPINDLLSWFLEKEANGACKIARYDPNRNIEPMIRSEIQTYRLKENPHCSYALFIKEKFSEIWGE